MYEQHLQQNFFFLSKLKGKKSHKDVKKWSLTHSGDSVKTPTCLEKLCLNHHSPYSSPSLPEREVVFTSY